MNVATDEKREEVAARRVMKMVTKSNNAFLSSVNTSRATRVEIECATFHHGVAVLPRIETIVLDKAKSDGGALFCDRRQSDVAADPQEMR